jgi:hypothetical protein
MYLQVLENLHVISAVDCICTSRKSVDRLAISFIFSESHLKYWVGSTDGTETILVITILSFTRLDASKMKKKIIRLLFITSIAQQNPSFDSDKMFNT